MRLLSLLLLACPIAAQANLAVGITTYNETCGQQNGMLIAAAYGGTAPYTYLWNNTSINDTISGLIEGWYSVQATDNVGATATQQVYLLDGPLNVLAAGWTPAGGLPCPGLCNGGFSIPLEGIYGQPPYSFGLNTGYVADPSYPHPLFMGFCDLEPITLTVTDGTGCSGTLDIFLDGPNAPPILATNINGACNGQPNGSTLLWMPEETAWDPSYYVTVHAPDDQIVGGYSGTGPQQVLLSDLWPGVYTIQRTHSATADGCSNTSTFVVPDAGDDCGTVSGDNWYDVDGDCVHDAGEVGIPFRVLEIQPGPEYAITSGDGHYSYNLQNGDYTLAQTDPTLIPICPVIQPVPFTVNNNAPVIDLADGSTIPLDLVAGGAQGFARPGFAYPLFANVVNPTPQVSGPVTITCTFDAILTYVSASAAPTSIVGNVITWDLPALGSFGSHQVAVEFMVPVATPLGTAVSSSFVASNTLTESNSTNNTFAFATTVFGSFDPNVKVARTSTGQSDTQYFIDQDQWIDYAIHFQNTGTDTAFTVVVTDTLAAELDMASFQQEAASHPFSVAFKPGRVVQWTFAAINLPDSNANEAESHGLVSFRIRPVQPLLAGTIFSNVANIFFDFNDPVITEPSVLTAEFSTGTDPETGKEPLILCPNPAADLITMYRASAEGATVDVRALDGRSVMIGTCRSGRSSLDIRALPSGVYSITVRGPSGSATRRFVKQ